MSRNYHDYEDGFHIRTRPAMYCTMLLLFRIIILYFFFNFMDAFFHQLLIGNQKSDDDDNYDGCMIACLASYLNTA